VVVPEFQVKFHDLLPLAVEMLLDWWVMKSLIFWVPVWGCTAPTWAPLASTEAQNPMRGVEVPLAFPVTVMV
jgi:hypothetical protein